MKKETNIFGKTNEWIDRDISWLSFNERVLLQITRTDMPISKRISFIGISANNMIEFISVRVASHINSKNKAIKTLISEVIKQKDMIHDYYMKINGELNLIGDVFEDNVPNTKLEGLFNKDIYPALTPIAVASNKEIPIFNEKDVNFFVEMHTESEPDEKLYCFLQIPHEIPRVFSLGHKKYLIEDIIESQLDKIFNNMIIDSYLLFTVYNNFDEDLNHDNSIPMVNRVNNILDKRRTNDFIFADVMLYGGTKQDKIVNKLHKLLEIPKRFIYFRDKTNTDTLGLHFMQSIEIKDKKKCEGTYNHKFKPRKDILDGNIYKKIDNRDIILYHPYESYEPVLKFIEKASRDPSTISIKQTLYRISSEESPIIKSLCYAATHGVQVTVMIELLARFDERRNISLIKALKKAGVNIVYSLEGMKTHCKMCLVVKAGKDEIKTYAHVGTGNYNEKTAKIYTDISYFTSKRKTCAELNSVFGMITGFGKPYQLKNVSYSPYTLRQTIMDEIDRVVANNQGKKRKIMIKCNAISDPDMVNFILDRADKNPRVMFLIIVRGICSLPPRKNIIIKSVIGRFLEHSRIYSFYDGEKHRTYISSADLLTRNLSRRIELLTRLDGKIASKLVRKIFIDTWLDTANSWTLEKDLEWHQMDTRECYYNIQDEYTR
jgi:polyphosphate kinase